MSTSTPIDTEELLEKLSQAVADWEDSPYYLKDEELFDLKDSCWITTLARLKQNSRRFTVSH